MCLFQALYPKKYTSEEESSQELFPFMKSLDGKCFSPADELIKDYRKSGFAIPGGDRLSDKIDPAALREKIRQYLTETYYW